MARSGFKMKGSPMQRNFGIGSPLHENEDDRKWYQKLSDEAKQVWEGLKSAKGPNVSAEIEGFKRGYRTEETTQKRQRETKKNE